MDDDAIIETCGTNNGGTADDILPVNAGGANPVDEGRFQQPTTFFDGGGR